MPAEDESGVPEALPAVWGHWLGALPWACLQPHGQEGPCCSKPWNACSDAKGLLNVLMCHVPFLPPSKISDSHWPLPLQLGHQHCCCYLSPSEEPHGNENALHSKRVPTTQGSCGHASQLLYKGRILWSKPLSFAPVFPWQHFMVMTMSSSDKQRMEKGHGVTPFVISAHTASHSLHHRGTEGTIRKVKVRKSIG